MRLIYCLMMLCLFSTTANAQEEKENKERKSVKVKATMQDPDAPKKSDTAKRKSIAIGTDGIHINDTGKFVEKDIEVEFSIVDIGINTIMDKTDYATAAAQGFLNVPANMKNANVFSLQTGRSWNVNVWPVVVKARLVNGGGQRLHVATGVGLQMYNFRFSKDISYLNNTNPEVFMDSVNFSKNKLGLTYLSVPLMLTAKTKFAKDLWLVYGVGATGGYRLSSWTKQISGARGKVKDHDSFNFSDFNACITGEIGIASYFRIYATYQLTTLHETALAQRPFCIGLRIGGV